MGFETALSLVQVRGQCYLRITYRTPLSHLFQFLTELTKHPDEFSRHEDTLRQQLSGLNAKEKLLIEKAFYRHEWTVGSASVVRLLCEKDLFSLPIYIFNLKDQAEQKNIFNDLLETEHYLLSRIVKSSLMGKYQNSIEANALI